MSTRGAKAAVIVAHVAATVIAVLLIGVIVMTALRGDLGGILPIAPFLFTTLAAGWLIAWKQPRNSLGWLLLGILAVFATQEPIGMIGVALLDVAPQAAAWLLWFGSNREDTWIWVPAIGLLFTQIPLRFPDGHPPSRGWRWFSWYTIAAIVVSSIILSTVSAEVYPGVPNPMPPIPAESLALWAVVAIVLGVTSFGGSVASLFVRYRRSGPLERAQLRWFLFATAVVALALVLSWAIPEDWGATNVVTTVIPLLYSLIPLSILFAVLRYRLYEIDRIISRTASYALVTVVVVAVYLLVVTSVSWLLPTLPAIGVALATLAAAAVFLPVLRWIRRIVDRRFNREQYDAERVVDAFGRRLRSGADPHSTAADLVAAVDSALAPATVGLWTAARPVGTDRGRARSATGDGPYDADMGQPGSSL